MKMLSIVLLAGGVTLASAAAAEAQSPYYPPTRGYSQQPFQAFQSPSRYVANRPSYAPPQTVAPRTVALSPVGGSCGLERPTLYPVQQTAYSAPAPQPMGVGFATPVVPSTTPVRPGSVVGRGIFGQPEVYVEGQPLRNAFRWLTL